MNARVVEGGANDKSPGARARKAVAAMREVFPSDRPLRAEEVAHLLGSVLLGLYTESDMRAALEVRIAALEAHQRDVPR